jgi:hypothetical protein
MQKLVQAAAAKIASSRRRTLQYVPDGLKEAVSAAIRRVVEANVLPQQEKRLLFLIFPHVLSAYQSTERCTGQNFPKNRTDQVGPWIVVQPSDDRWTVSPKGTTRTSAETARCVCAIGICGRNHGGPSSEKEQISGDEWVDPRVVYGFHF